MPGPRNDIHCHCLPGLDDGPRDMTEALALCRALVDDGITTVIATPHQLGMYQNRCSAEAVYSAVDQLRRALAAEDIPLRVEPGGEVRVDPQLLPLLDRGEALCLAGENCYLLLELPHDVMINLLPLLDALRQRGVRAILSHPERHHMLSRHPELLQPLLHAGALLQVTAGSLLGEFGSVARASAWHLIGSGRAALVASDAHDSVKRPPRMSQAFAAIANELGLVVARRLCVEHPRRVLAGEEIPLPLTNVQRVNR